MNDTLLYLLAIAAFVGVYQLVRINDRLRMIEARMDALLGQSDPSYGDISEPSDRVKELAKDPRQRIEAIKAYRQQTGLALKEAKAVIDGLAKSEPGAV